MSVEVVLIENEGERLGGFDGVSWASDNPHRTIRRSSSAGLDPSFAGTETARVHQTVEVRSLVVWSWLEVHLIPHRRGHL